MDTKIESFFLHTILEMSGFASQQFADDGAVVVSSSTPSTFTTPIASFDVTTKYLVLVDGLAKCPGSSGVLLFDILFNGKKVLNTRQIQTSSTVATTPLSVNWPVDCADCTQSTADDGTVTFNNNLVLQFTWSPPSGSNVATLQQPTVESLSVSMLAVA